MHAHTAPELDQWLGFDSVPQRGHQNVLPDVRDHERALALDGGFALGIGKQVDRADGLVGQAAVPADQVDGLVRWRHRCDRLRQFGTVFVPYLERAGVDHVRGGMEQWAAAALHQDASNTSACQ